MMSKHILTLFALTSLVEASELPFLKKHQKLPNCEQYTSKPRPIRYDYNKLKCYQCQRLLNRNYVKTSAQLSSLFTFVCNNTVSGGDNVFRDACIGCFQQASRSNNNQPSLTDLNECAQNYLTDTRYEVCTDQIDRTTPNPGTGSCVIGYCRFVRCVRRINSDLLIAQCYEAASVDNDAITEEDQIMLVKNVTSCILARTRCASVNPISGQRQSNFLTTTTYDKWGKPKTNTIPLYNSLQISPEGDLRVILLPGTTKIQNYFCTAQLNLRESSWLEYFC